MAEELLFRHLNSVFTKKDKGPDLNKKRWREVVVK